MILGAVYMLWMYQRVIFGPVTQPANDRLRDEIMPINKKYPLADLMQACREYPGADNARRITSRPSTA